MENKVDFCKLLRLMSDSTEGAICQIRGKKMYSHTRLNLGAGGGDLSPDRLGITGSSSTGIFQSTLNPATNYPTNPNYPNSNPNSNPNYPSWQQHHIPKPVRSREAPITYDSSNRSITPWQRRDGPYLVYCLAAIDEFAGSQLSMNEIRGFSYLNQMGLLGTAFESGYAREARELMVLAGKGSAEKDRGGTVFGGNSQQLGSTYLQQQGSYPPQRSSQQGGYQGSYPANTQQGSYQGSYPPQGINAQQTGIFATKALPGVFMNPPQPQLPQQNMFSPSPSSQPPLNAVNNPNGIFGNQMSNNMFGHGLAQPIPPQLPQLPPNYVCPPVPYDPQLVHSLDSTVLSHISQSLLQHYHLPLTLSLLEAHGITPDIIDFLFAMGLSQEQVQGFIVKRILLKQLQAPRSSHSPSSAQCPSCGCSSNSGRGSGGYDDKFGRYVDFVLRNREYTWQEQVLQEGMRRQLQESPLHPTSRTNQRANQLMLELDQMDDEMSSYFCAEGRMGKPATNSLKESIWLQEEDAQQFGLSRIGIRNRICRLG